MAEYRTSLALARLHQPHRMAVAVLPRSRSCRLDVASSKPASPLDADDSEIWADDSESCGHVEHDASQSHAALA